MPERQLMVTNSKGLHTRPSVRLARTVGQYDARVRLFYRGQEADGQSVISLLLLAAGHGEALRVVAEGPEAEQVLLALEQLAAEKFGEAGDYP